MQLTIYREGRTFSFQEYPGADSMTARVPDGTEVLPFGRLGQVAFVPSGQRTRFMVTARDLWERAMLSEGGCSVHSMTDARSRHLQDRIAKLREELTVRQTAKRLGISATSVMRAIGSKTA